MSISHIPYWLERTPRARRPTFGRLRGENRASVAIVGGGLTGCACAFSFAHAGMDVVLLEADTIGQENAARGTGLVREDFDASFRETVDTHGLAAARSMWQSLHRSSLEFAAALRRLDVRCDLAAEDLLAVVAADAAAAKSLEREYAARRAGGLRHTRVTSAAILREAAIQSGGAIRTRGAKLDPYRATLGLAAAAVQRGARIYQDARVTRIRGGQKQVEVVTLRGVVRADTVIVATSQPIADLSALRRHLKPAVRYSVVTAPFPSAVRRAVGARTAALRHGSEPPHLLRWLPEERALWTGADGPPVPPRAREKTLIQRTGQLMYELSLLYPAMSGIPAEWSWDATHYNTADGLPFAGLHRNFPHHLFAMGGSSHGPAFSWLAARVLLRAIQGQPAKGDELFGFARIL